MGKDELGLLQILTDIKTDQRTIVSDLKKINKRFDGLPCPVNTYKISLLQKVIYGGIGIILFAFMVGLVNDNKITKNLKMPTSAQASIDQKVK